MGSSDIPPAHVPSWVIPASTVSLAIGVVFWQVTYVLMGIRSIRTKSYGMPLLALAVNISWEIVYCAYVAEMFWERLGFGIWLALEAPLIYATVKFGHQEWAHSPFVARWLGTLLAIMMAVGLVGNFAFAVWWLDEPGRGSGDKTGKFFRGMQGYDCTELAFWSAAVLQLPASAGSLAMLLVRGHSGGTSYAIWFSRAIGSCFGLTITSGLLWLYWPEAHGYFTNPFGIFLCVTSYACDIMYPFALRHVRASERILPNGRVVAGSWGVSKGKVKPQ